MDTAANLRTAQALADSGRRDAELASLCVELVDDPALPESAQGRVLVWLAESQLATGDTSGVARTVARAATLDLPTAQRRALERALMAARNRAAGRIPVPKPAIAPPRPAPAPAARRAASTRKAPARKATTSASRPAAPPVAPAVQRLLAAVAPTPELVGAAAGEVDATGLVRASAELRKRGLAASAAELGVRALEAQPALGTSSVAVVAVVTSLEECGRRHDAERVLEPLLLQGPEGLTTDRFLLTHGLRLVTDEELADRIRARLEAG